MSDLKTYVDRIVKAEEEKKDVQEFIKDIYVEAKAKGFDTKALKRLVKDVQKKIEDLKQEEQMIETYRLELGIKV